MGSKQYQERLEKGNGEVAEAIAADLNVSEQEEALKRSAPRAVVLHEAIREEGEEELRRPLAALWWSGLAAGLSMGFSLVAEGLIRAYLPDASWRPLISKFGYSLGFMIVILGRQQLFTENTLTPILPLLVQRNLKTLYRVLRLWAVVLAANLLGALIFAWVVGNTDVFHSNIRQAFSDIGREAMDGSYSTVVLRAVFAGWLIALMVWLLPYAESARVTVIIIITFIVGLGGFAHIIAGSVEVFQLAVTSQVGWDRVIAWVLSTLTGNIIGGVSLVAALNHAQVIAGKRRNRENRVLGQTES